MSLLELMNLFHAIGLAWGVGGVTIIAIIQAKAGKDKESAPHLMKLMPAISKLIWAGMGLLIISGIVLVPLITWPMDPFILLIKHIIVVLLVINGVLFYFFQDRGPAKILGPVGLVLWYAVLVLSVVM